MMRSHQYRIVLSDWEMPGMSGPELCKKMRNASSSRYTYFILLTSHNAPGFIVHGLEAGADDFISRPFNPAELRVRLQSAERIDALDTMDITIFAMAKLAESRDPETGAHLERVRQYVRIIARELKNTTGHEEVDEEFIPLAARIMALADVYDALTSKRVYKDAFTHKVASDIILDGAGSHFDPQVIMIFQRVEAQLEKNRLSYMDQLQSAA